MSSCFKIVVPTQGGKHFFKKIDKIMKERGRKALRPQKKQQMACEIHKMASTMHTVVFVDGALEAKNAQFMGESAIFDRLMERNRTERTKER